MIENGECILISQLSFRWLIENIDGILVADELVSELFNPYRIKNVSELLEYLNTRSRNLGWGIEASFSKWEEDRTEVITIEHGDPSLRSFLAEIISIFLARYLNLDVSFVHRKSNSIQIFLKEYISETNVPLESGIISEFWTLHLKRLKAGRISGPLLWKDIGCKDMRE